MCFQEYPLENEASGVPLQRVLMEMGVLMVRWVKSAVVGAEESSVDLRLIASDPCLKIRWQLSQEHVLSVFSSLSGFYSQKD